MRYTRRCKLRSGTVLCSKLESVPESRRWTSPSTVSPWESVAVIAARPPRAHRSCTPPSTNSPWELVAVTMTSPPRAQPSTGTHSDFAVMYATQHHLSLRVGRGDYDPPLAGSGGDEGWLLALSWGRPGVQVRDKGTGQVLALGWAWSRGWWYRLGCRARSFLFEAHLPVRESGVRGRGPPGEEITKQVLSPGMSGTYE